MLTLVPFSRLSGLLVRIIAASKELFMNDDYLIADRAVQRRERLRANAPAVGSALA